jgi:hypothetical protein
MKRARFIKTVAPCDWLIPAVNANSKTDAGNMDQKLAGNVFSSCSSPGLSRKLQKIQHEQSFTKTNKSYTVGTV